ncbi:MAG TPA: hypothetical protein VGN32_16240 [Ktedonobacterales bacterium]|jgi:hypothetical protein|nr:hypothetical protein [Ktedonobacterales bacterium]
MLPLLLAALLGLCALIVVLAPLFSGQSAPAASDSIAASLLAERERAAKAALQDVEFDHQLGNLADDDYRGLRERYTRRALVALKGRYDRERALDDAIEAQVRALRERATTSPAHDATPPDLPPRKSGSAGSPSQTSGSAGSPPRARHSSGSPPRVRGGAGGEVRRPRRGRS